jgi:hypothetical protein
MQASAAARREWTVGHDPYRRGKDTLPTGQCWSGGLVGAFGHAESVEDRYERSRNLRFQGV